MMFSEIAIFSATTYALICALPVAFFAGWLCGYIAARRDSTDDFGGDFTDREKPVGGTSAMSVHRREF